MGETHNRIERIDGSLQVTPAPTPRHRAISHRLARLLEEPAAAAGLLVLPAVNLRLKPGRIPIPDLVLADAAIDRDELVVPAERVALVAEIFSPSTAMTDRVQKMHVYAAAGIDHYLLLVEPRGPRLHLHRREGDTYAEGVAAGPGARLELTDPVRVTIDPAALLP
ncbi:hypothetical protein GCM10010123_33110 [Pilimelia anulata]|uniref:Putative restriction endonuclease domain-containing protein n=1 Tax=Pilimelia anulata TaxID=53371 RepID=A0A8J3B761_9ACTN|nr:Uma2 family endonuclease [Pilimelia anulata]GGK00567.1 hypothetical protein GCM10010123_33110 [Pilimelia anulata]